ncbi:putative membrane protein [Micavibrio aeruginosavorus ARL-13]|uniref:Putative membrane protein n=2 Tax=Micavibrio aeruginosavorus TaxID=349221 RepID=G2KT66_MICAA|nr:putative membrane protein [Micavibrio aeruginosavorus ARL-13]
MPGIQPTYGIIETGRNVRAFTKGHQQEFWALLVPILPWIIGLDLVDVLGNMMWPALKGKFVFGSLVAGYFCACFIIGWHRVLLHGPERAKPVDPFHPEKSDLAFIGMGWLLVVAGFALVVFSTVLGAALFSAVSLRPAVGLLTLAAILGVLYCGYRLCFYFPAKAVRSHMSFKESFDRTDGYVWRLLCTPFVGAWRLFLGCFAYSFAVGFIAGFIGHVIGVQKGVPAPMGFQFFVGLLQLPMAFYFIPLFTAFGVGVLSNYYQYSLQNDPQRHEKPRGRWRRVEQGE